MTIHVLQTSPTTGCQRGIWTSKTVLWAFMTQNPGGRVRAKDVLAGNGEEFWSKRWRRSSLRPGYPQGHPDAVRFGLDLQLHSPSLEPGHGLLQSLGKGAPISNWSAQIRLFLKFIQRYPKSQQVSEMWIREGNGYDVYIPQSGFKKKFRIWVDFDITCSVSELCPTMEWHGWMKDWKS